LVDVAVEAEGVVGWFGGCRFDGQADDTHEAVELVLFVCLAVDEFVDVDAVRVEPCD